LHHIFHTHFLLLVYIIPRQPRCQVHCLRHTHPTT
jgi:hypothetical protein